MIYRFRIVSDEVDDFKREILIDADRTFLDLRNAICDATGFDRGIMSSFFICEDDWEKIREISLEDMGSDSSEDVFLMADSVIGDHLDDTGQRLMFTFDYMTDRSLFMELKDIATGKSLDEAQCVVSVGEPPAQTIDFDEFDASLPIIPAANSSTAGAFDDEDEFYGSSDYNDDEINLDEMSFDQ